MREPLRQRITGSTNTSSAVDVALRQVKPGEVWRVTHLALFNESGESVTLKLGLLQGSTFQQIWAKQTVADADAFGVAVEILLLEGDKLDAQVTGTAKIGKVTFIVSGELHQVGPQLVIVKQAA
jgi:hypothetical protein